LKNNKLKKKFKLRRRVYVPYIPNLLLRRVHYLFEVEDKEKKTFTTYSGEKRGIVIVPKRASEYMLDKYDDERFVILESLFGWYC